MKNEYTRAEVGIVIPAFDPNENLYTLIDRLLLNFQNKDQIVIVDDGSSRKYIFEEIKALKNNNIHIVKHPINLGKGEALKTGFKYLIANYPSIDGIATMDADGQHTVADLKECITLFNEHLDGLILGRRSFSKNVPWRSRFGNNLTKVLTHVFTGISISDTQTGLRIIPIDYAKKSLNFSGKRYAFEFDMLLQTKVYGISIFEQPIDTIYIDENSESHFNVFFDSLSIYFRFIKFALSGLVSFLFDIIIFSTIIYVMKNNSLKTIMVATIVSRLLSAIINYLINRHWVFAKEGKVMIVKYAMLMIFQMLCSAYLTSFLLRIISSDTTATGLTTMSKVVADFVLFLVSYQIQKRFVFSGGEKNGNK